MKKLYIGTLATAISSLLLSAQISVMPLSADMTDSLLALYLPHVSGGVSITNPKAKDLAKLCIKTTLPVLPSEDNREVNKPSLSVLKENPSVLSLPDDLQKIPDYIEETQITKGGTSLFGIEINNETDYKLQDALKEVSLKDSPTILIIHTHTSESYRPSSLFSYSETDNSRTEDTNFNVARVGAELASCLTGYGINVIHDSSINDYPSYNGSYKKALGLIQEHLSKNPSIDMVIDLHRDAMERADGTVVSTVSSVNGEKAAQVMLVVGTDQGGLTHQNWRDNFSFALSLQKAINESFPNLARPVNVRKERFNGHVSKKELIIEVGTTGNTLEEALVSARALAFAINELYKG